MTQALSSRTGLVALVVGSLVTLAAKPSHAEQFTLFDETFEFTWEDAINSTPSKSHHYVKGSALNALRPTNWSSPIDYRKGKVHIHLEVLEKPEGGQEQGWALCYVGGGSYGCPYTKYYTEPGVYDNEVDMTSFYNNNTIDWTKGITEVDLIYTINNSGQGHVHFFPELKDKTTPTKVRIAMVQVSAGATYDPSQLPGGSSGGAGGAGGMGGAAGNAAGGGGSGNVIVGGSGGLASGGGGGTGGSDPVPGGASGAGGSAPASGGVATGGGGSAAAAGTGTGPANPTSVQESGCNFGHSGRSELGGMWVLAALGLISRSRRHG